MSVAIAIAMDRSGSMAAPAAGGKTKMDLANLGAAEVVNLLSPMDEVGVIAVDSTPHTVVPLTDVRNKGRIRGKILRVQSMGGGIFVYEALVAASDMLMKAKAQTRHIILFSDAADSEQPGKYRELLAKCRKAGITCSVIGLGTKTDPDAGFLQDVAKRGGGRCYFTNRPTELPRLFAQDTFVVARSAFVDEPTPVRITGGMAAVSSRRFGKPPLSGGYNLCYLRSGANLAMVTEDEYSAPFVAAWQAGVGRVLCYTGQADGRFTGALGRWSEIGPLLTSLARWTAGREQGLPEDMLLTQEVRNGVCEVRLHLDPERQGPLLPGLPKVSTLTAAPGRPPEAKHTTLRYLDAETLGVSVPLSGSETAVTTVTVPGVTPVALPPVCLPYSPEFRPVDAGRGRAALEQIARATGGAERVELAEMWELIPRWPRQVDIGRWLLLAAAMVLVVEILERRTGLVATGAGALWRRRPMARRRREAEPVVEAGEEARPRRTKRPARRRAPAEADAGPAQQAPAEAPDAAQEPASSGGMFDAMKTARARAKGRTRDK